MAFDSSASCLAESNWEQFASEFNQRPFTFQHNLSGHPLFQLSRLVQLARSKSSPDEIYLDQDVRDVNQRWNETPPSNLSVEQIIDRIEHERAWVILRRADTDPDYKLLLERCMMEIEER